MIFMRGATDFEFQFRRLGVRWCFLKGRYWRWKPWRRLSFQWFDKDQL